MDELKGLSPEDKAVFLRQCEVNTTPHHSKLNVLPEGTGYWRIDLYPIGGDFHRVKEDTPITQIIEELTTQPGYPRGCHGCTHIVLLSNGHKAAVDVNNTI